MIQHITTPGAIIGILLLGVALILNNYYPEQDRADVITLPACKFICTDRNEYDECITYRRAPWLD